MILVSAPEKEDLEVPDETDLLAVFEAAETAELTAYEDAASEAALVPELPEPAEIVEREHYDGLGVTRWELGNGVRVLLKPTDFKDDEIVMRALSPGGTSLAPDSTYLAASTAATVVSQGGVGEFSLIDLQKKLAGKAVRVSPFIATLGEGFSGSVSPADVETMFRLIYLYFTAPRRDPDAFQSFKTRVQAFLENRSADPNAAFRDTIRVTMTQGHFRTRPPSKELYEEMDLDRSLEFYRDRFADASDFTFVFVGNLQVDSIEPLVRTYIGGLPSIDRDEIWRDEGIVPPKGVIEKAVYKGIEPKSQTQIFFTGPFQWDRRNQYVLRSLSQVLRIRLREVMREDMGGTYGVGVGASGERDPRERYQFRISFGSDPDRVDELIQALFNEIDRLKTEGPSREDIDKVKEQQRRAREENLRDNGYWLSQLIIHDRYGRDYRDILTYEKLIDSLTAEDVQEAARRYLSTDNYVRVTLFPEEAAEEES